MRRPWRHKEKQGLDGRGGDQRGPAGTSGDRWDDRHNDAGSDADKTEKDNDHDT